MGCGIHGLSAVARRLGQGWGCSARRFSTISSSKEEDRHGCGSSNAQTDGTGGSNVQREGTDDGAGGSKQSPQKQDQAFEELGLDDITSLITSKCRILANPNAGHGEEEPEEEEEKDKDPVKIFQNCWGWRNSDECRYEDSPSSSSSPSCFSVLGVSNSAALSRKQRMVESASLREIAASILQNGWNPSTQQDFTIKIPELTPFHVCHILKSIQEPDLCVRIFDWAKQRPGYRHTTRSYNALFGVLAGRMDAVALMHLQKQMTQDGCEPDKVTLCTLIRGYSKAQQPNKVLELYNEMRESEWEPGVVTYSCIIDILAKHGYTDKAREVYFEMRMSGCYLDKTGYNIIINLFGRKKNLHMATRLYKDMCECGLDPDGYTYAALIQTHLKVGDATAAHKLFIEALDKKLSVSLATCNALIYALGKAGELDLSMSVYFELEKIGLRPEAPTYSTLVSALGQRDRICDLHIIIEDMASKDCKELGLAYSNAVEWLVLGGNVPCACKLVLDFIKRLGGANNTAMDALLENFVKVGAVDQIHDFLRDMAACEFKLDAPKLSNLVKSLCEAGNVDGALKIFYAMGELGYAPDRNSYNSVIMCLSKFGSLFQALRFFDDMNEIGLSPSTDTCNHLIHILCIKGDMKSAIDIFHKMDSGECTPNVGTYNQLIAGYANLSDWAMAFKLSKDMEDSWLAADSDTYMPLIFSLGNEGRIEHALQLCKQMLDKGLKPSSSRVCTKLLEMLSRKGQKKDALSAFTKLKSMGEFTEFSDYDSYLVQRRSF